MKEFVLIFRLNSKSDAKPSPEQMQERLNWLGSIAAQNKLADRGKTLSVTNAKTIKSGNIISDGLYTEIKEFISGFMVVKTNTIEEAIELAKASPVFNVGGFVEVREAIAPPANS